MALVKCILNNHEVEYDDSEFEFIESCESDHLHYIGSGINVTNPKGNTSCYRMFDNYSGKSLDLTNFHTNNVTSFVEMFSRCYNLENLNLSNFKTNEVLGSDEMFSNCKKLKKLNLSNFTTEYNMGMYGMFFNCESLEYLDVSNFNIRNVECMNDMFFNCHELKELDISSFHFCDTQYLSEFDYMFWDCKSLEKLKVNSDSLQFFLDNKKSLFRNCGNVNIIPVSKLDRAVNDLFY